MGAPWVAAEQTAEGEPCSFQGTVDFDRLDAVVAARGIMSTHTMPTTRQTEPWGNGQLVKADQFCEHPGHAAASTLNPQNTTYKGESSQGIQQTNKPHQHNFLVKNI